MFEMHEWWCSREESVNAKAGTEDGDQLRKFCDGWEEHKLKKEL